jgi:polyhydroxybutyrate depolymerase
MSRLSTLVLAVAVAFAACSTTDNSASPTTAFAPATTSTTIATPAATATPAPTTADTSGVTTTAPVTTTSLPVVGSGDPVDGPGTYNRSMTVDDTERQYTLHISEDAWAASGVALVIDLHGLGSTAASQAELSGFRDTADTEGFVVAQPQAAGALPTWQAGVSPSPDVEFLRSVIADVEGLVDVGPVFVAGFSNGAGMAHRLACDAPEEVVAIGTVAGAYPDSGPCVGPVPVVTFHGALDPVVPYRGAGFVLPDIAEWAASWADRAGCETAATSNVAAGVDLIRWEGCPQGQAVELYVVAEGRHGWPGTVSQTRFLDSTDAVSATDIMWRFFQDVSG